MMIHSRHLAAKLALAAIVASIAGTAMAQTHKHRMPTPQGMSAFYDRVEPNTGKFFQPAPVDSSGIDGVAAEGGPN